MIGIQTEKEEGKVFMNNHKFAILLRFMNYTI
jgi:hypothetical protein